MTTNPMTIGAGPRMAHVAVHSIAPSLTNPRKHFDPAKLQELADSIAASGVHQPILLRPLPAHRLEDTLQTARANKQAAPEYELVAGERRWRACQLAGVKEVPAMVRELTDAQALEAQIIENLQREDVTELEEAESYRALMDSQGISVDAIAAKVGRSRSYIFSRLKVLDLCEHGRQLLREGKLDFSCALPIARIPSEVLQMKALEKACQPLNRGDTMSAREVLHMVRMEFMTKLEYASFDRTDASLCPAAGACTTCPHRTGNAPDMFADVDSADVCTNPPCYHAKEDAHKAQVRERALASGCDVITGREAKSLIPTPYTGSIEGHVRLDVPADSPVKGKPLRAVVGAVMEQAGIKPTLVENPHTKELVAVVRKEQAAELLKMAGKAEAEAKLRQEQAADAEAAKRQAELDAKERYEQMWRTAVAVQTIHALCESTTTATADALAERSVAQHVLRNLNKDEASKLAAILQLGKVAPHDALQDYAEESTFPILVAAAVLILRDSSYNSWAHKYQPESRANALLLDMAAACKVDVEAIKAKTQATLRAKAEAKKAAASPDKPEAPKANTPLNPASRQSKGAGVGKGKNRKGPAALAGGGGVQLSQDEAAARIAAAMQALPESESGAAAPGDEAGPVVADATQAQPPSAGILFATDKTIRAQTPAAAGTGESAPGGQDGADVQTGAAAKQALKPEDLLGNRVVILPNATGKGQKIYIGDEGTVVAIIGPEAVDVSFPGPKGCKPVRIGFHTSEVELVTTLEEA